MSLEEYVEGFQVAGDAASESIDAKAVQTLLNPKYNGRNLIDVLQPGKGGLKVIRPPEEFNIAVYTVGSQPNMTLPYVSTMRMIRDGALFAEERLNGKAVGISDIIDIDNMDNPLLQRVHEGLVDGANDASIAILNGETAKLGSRLTEQPNVTITFAALVPKTMQRGVHFVSNTHVAVFDPKGESVYMNSDGTGTLLEFYERLATLHDSPQERLAIYAQGLQDLAAMVLDDASRKAATVHVLSGLMEYSGLNPGGIQEHASMLADSLTKHGIPPINYTVQAHEMSGRIMSYKKGIPALNYNATGVSTINEQLLKNPPKPLAEQVLLAATPKFQTRRCNGVSAWRETCELMGGQEWHTDPKMTDVLDFMTRAAPVFYPAFYNLIESKAASAVYHMSGGAIDGKLAAPLADHGLYVEIRGLVEPDPIQVRLADFMGAKPENRRTVWPYGTEGYIATSDPRKAAKILEAHNFTVREVGKLQPAGESSGVRIMDEMASNGQPIYFSGKKDR